MPPDSQGLDILEQTGRGKCQVVISSVNSNTPSEGTIVWGAGLWCRWGQWGALGQSRDGGEEESQASFQEEFREDGTASMKVWSHAWYPRRLSVAA